MLKLLNFLKSKKYVIQWTIGYFAFAWLFFKFIFNFDIFLTNHWIKFFHSHFNGFIGNVFCFFVYSLIPIYIATTMVVNRKNTLLIKIPLIDKIFEFISKFFPQKEIQKEPEPEPEISTEPETFEYPQDLPPELRVPFMRAKQKIKISSSVSVYNKIQNTENITIQNASESFSEILPTDFDIPESDSNSLPDFNPENDFVPTFTDINFDDEPKPEKKRKLHNKIF